MTMPHTATEPDPRDLLRERIATALDVDQESVDMFADVVTPAGEMYGAAVVGGHQVVTLMLDAGGISTWDPWDTAAEAAAWLDTLTAR